MRRFLAAGLAAAALTGNALACTTELPDHLRILDCRLATAVVEGTRRSPTLSDLVDRIGRSNGLVYVVPAPHNGTTSNLLGGLVHDVAFAGRYRMLRIFVSQNAGDQAIATLGHELRHALEELDRPGTTREEDEGALDGVTAWRTGSRTIETQAALDAGHAIERELRTARSKRPSVDDELAAQANVLR